MKKQEFLDELKRYLRVLQDEEQEDILEEYSQHIEMKIESGLSEDEAIKDFGSIRELAGEILEAYHVKLKDEEGEGEGRLHREKKNWGEVLPAAFVKACAINTVNAGKMLLSGIGMFLHFLGKPFSLAAKWMGRQREKLRERSAGTGRENCAENENSAENAAGTVRITEAAETARIIEAMGTAGNTGINNNAGVVERAGISNNAGAVERARIDKTAAVVERAGAERTVGGIRRKTCAFEPGNTKEKRNKREMTKMISWMAKAVKRMCSGVVACICWSGRMLWNCGIICVAVCFAGLGLIFLYLFGMLLILWNRGYPLGGIVIGSLGAVLCFASLTVFGSTFYRGKRQLCRAGENDGKSEYASAVGENNGRPERAAAAGENNGKPEYTAAAGENKIMETTIEESRGQNV